MLKNIILDLQIHLSEIEKKLRWHYEIGVCRWPMEKMRGKMTAKLGGF